jgi:hypothetical protein
MRSVPGAVATGSRSTSGRDRYCETRSLPSLCQNSNALSANGAKCNSPGQRPGLGVLGILEALKARNTKESIKTVLIMTAASTFRAFSAGNLQLLSYLGRWPRLLHFAPLALSGLSFDIGSTAPGSDLITQGLQMSLETVTLNCIMRRREPFSTRPIALRFLRKRKHERTSS